MTTTVQQILESVETFVLNEAQQAEVKAAAWWKSFEPIAADDFSKFVTMMKPIAYGLVVGIAEAALPGPAKLAVTSAQLVAAAKAQGLAASVTMANTLIQQIVVSLGLVAGGK